MINTNSVMKNLVKYICAVVILIGTSAHAWGVTITLMAWDKSSSAYVEVGTFEKGNQPGYGPGTYSGGYLYNIAWAPGAQNDSKYPTNGGGDNGSTYYNQYGYPTSNYNGSSLTLYAVYSYGGYYTTAPDVQFTDLVSCSDPSASVGNSSKTVNYGASTFNLTASRSGSGVVTWSTSDASVVSLSSKSSTGVTLTFGRAGTATVTYSVAADGTNNYCADEATCEVTVNAVTPTLSNTVSGKEFAVSAITAHGATFSGGVVTSKGNASITRYGFVIGTSSTVVVGGTGANKPVIGSYWSSDINLNTAFGSKTATSGLAAGTTYYARPWAYNGELYGYGPAVSFTTLAEYDIDLDKNNSDEGSTDGLATVVENGTTIEIEAPTRTGYTIEGYYTTDGLVTKVATSAGALQANITVSATNWTNGSSQWVKAGGATFYTQWNAKEYTVALNQNGGSGGSTGITATFGSAMPSATMPTTPPTGKTFDGYYYNSVKYYNADGSSAHVWDVDDDVTLVASWTTATPTLTIASVDNVVISSTTPSLAEGASTSVAYNSTVTLSPGALESGYYWLGWNVYETGNASNIVTVTNNQFTMPDHDVTVSANLYTGLVFSCASLTLTEHLVTDGTPIFITSTANKKVRSQDYITITGSGLTPSTDLTFPGLDSKFEVLTATGGTISTDASGAINVNAYIFYTPAADATTDGLDEMPGITVSVDGAKPKQASLTHSIIGRHLPAQFVVAGKKNNKWYAMPSNMSSTKNPKPSEIAVDNLTNPTIAYVADTTIYSLEGPTNNNISGGNGQYIRFVMMPLWVDDADYTKGHAPLFGNSTGSNDIGKSGNSQATSDLPSGGWWWQVKQTNTSITNPQDAKYTIYNHNNTSSLSLRDNAGNPDWGLFASGVEELRLIPASDIKYAEAYFIEWAQHGGVIEVDAETISATKVKAILGAAESVKIPLVETKTSGKNRDSKYNYTVNFGDVIDFAASTSNGALLTLEWYNSSDVLVAKTSMVVPKIIAASGDMKTIMSGDAQWETEVHVLPGVTLTANGGSFENSDVRINLLEIYPGATVKVTTGTLNVASLVLRNGWTRAGTKKFDVARLHIASTANLTKANVTDKWYTDWYVDYDQYYSISVPWEVTLANVTYRYCSVEPTVGYSGNIRLRYYDGEQRAETAQSMIGQNWKDYGKSGNTAVPSKLLPSMGYAMNAKRPTGKAFSIIRMPMDFPGNSWTAGGEKGNVTVEAVTTHKDQVAVTGWGYGTSTPWYAMGWNFIGNPYMYDFSGNDDGISGKMEMQNGGSIRYATIPDEGFKNYDQVNITSTPLRPATGFFIQANSASEQTITFSASKIVPPSAPALYRTTDETVPDQEAYIRLSHEGGKDQMGLIIGEDYTEAYEVNADLAKVLGDAGYVKTYMRYAGMDLAYVAINETLAREWIPVTVILPTAGEYTYSLMSSSEVEHLEGVYLIDYANENKVTNLINENYVFTAEAGTISNRFAINAIVGERPTPTDIDVVGADKNGDGPIKFLYRDKVYIWHHGNIYDATGKKVKEINK